MRILVSSMLELGNNDFPFIFLYMLYRFLQPQDDGGTGTKKVMIYFLCFEYTYIYCLHLTMRLTNFLVMINLAHFDFGYKIASLTSKPIENIFD